MAIFSKKSNSPGISLELAHKMLEAAVQKAEKLGVPENIAIVDEGNNLVAFARMDGAWIGSIDIAMKKAYTARAFDMSTEALGKMAEPGKPLYGIHVTNEGKVVIFGGGLPIKKGDRIIGAIGVSGGTVSQDISVAEAGVSALG